LVGSSDSKAGGLVLGLKSFIRQLGVGTSDSNFLSGGRSGSAQNLLLNAEVGNMSVLWKIVVIALLVSAGSAEEKGSREESSLDYPV
jgi:hypothetical protein